MTEGVHKWMNREKKKTCQHNRYSSSSSSSSAMVSCIFYRAISSTNIQACTPIYILFHEWPRIMELRFIKGCVCAVYSTPFFSSFCSKRWYSWPFVRGITFFFSRCISTRFARCLCYVVPLVYACVQIYLFVCSPQPFLQMVHIIHYFVTA